MDSRIDPLKEEDAYPADPATEIRGQIRAHCLPIALELRLLQDDDTINVPDLPSLLPVKF